MRHIIRSQQFDRFLIEALFARADRLRDQFETPMRRTALGEILRGKLMFAIFYEASTRTRFSFSAAAAHLGMQVVATENAREFSSAVKGETLEDSLRALCEYSPDVIVLRHHETGAADRAAIICDQYGVSLINAGDGAGQHPTQALLDLYTIKREIGRLDDLTVVIGGDLAYGRTARSLAYLLAKFQNVRLVFVSPPELAIRADIAQHLKEHNVPFREETSLEASCRDADVVYWTRIQKERIADPKITAALLPEFRITPRTLAWLKPHTAILHPLPRVDEIAKEVDQDRRAAYFRQVRGGMFVRMALLTTLLAPE